MTYFKNIKTLEELRKEYKRLVKENHPDNGGSEDAIKVINAIINLNIEIEICGSWVWVSGSTYSCKDDLKSNGFQWASKKKMWFWHDPEAPVKSHGKTSMNDIRTKYGSEVIKSATTQMFISA